MKILFVSAEVAPYAKVGGLADVAGSLPKALSKLGVDIRIAMPKYKIIEEEKFSLKSIVKNLAIPFKNTKKKVEILEGSLKGEIPVYFIKNKEYFERDEIYGATDDIERFTIFCKAVLEMLEKIDFIPDVIHTNDWHTALIPVYLKTLYKDKYKNISSVFTIHNLGYQGITEFEYLKIMGIPEEEFTMEKLEFYGKVNLMKGGIVYSDIVTTVSEKYAEEIQTKEYGEGLEGVIHAKKQKLFGIINGIDYEEVNPLTDKRIFVNYDLNTIEKKVENKLYLQKEQNMEINRDIPLIGLISRLASQKGLDLVSEAIEEMMQENLQFVLLGKGDIYYENLFKEISKKYPHKTGINLKFDIELAQKIYAGADMFLMPSRYEPCGLGQMFALRYGTIPIVRKTGGLADTVTDFNEINKQGNGFVFEEYTKEALFSTIKRALRVYQNKSDWKKLIENAFEGDYSWENSARKYLKIYEKAIRKEGD
jgi:starch synthase